MKHISRNTAVVILAAGLGTRMKSDMAKVLHCVGGRPMVNHVVDTAAAVTEDDIVVVTGYQSEQVREVVSQHRTVGFALQEKQLGTGHAVLCAMPCINASVENVVILCGDVPLLSPRTVALFVQHHEDQENILTVLAVRVDDPTGYGRMVVDRDGALVRIVEQADATADEQKINLINSGIYCVDRGFLEQALNRLTPDNAQGELYLTDIISIAAHDQLKIGLYTGQDAEEVVGVNSIQDLQQAERILSCRQGKTS